MVFPQRYQGFAGECPRVVTGSGGAAGCFWRVARFLFYVISKRCLLMGPLHLSCTFAEMVGWLRSVGRFFFFGGYSVYTICRYFAWRVAGHAPEVAARRIRGLWLGRVPPAMGLRILPEGEPYPGPCLYVGNHVSSVDPVMALSFVEANVVAKVEVRRYPVIGFGASLVGTIYVNRDERESRSQTVSAIRDALQAGKSILIFPEGTTSAGPVTLPFRPRAFEAAAQAGVPVQPIAHFYETPKAAFVGDMSFLGHFFELFKEREIRGHVAFGPILRGEDALDAAKTWIDERMMAYHTQYRSHVAS